LEASLPMPPRRPRNVARKCVAKKLKVTETTSKEVSSSSRVVEYVSWSICVLTVEFWVVAGISIVRPRGPGGRRRLGHGGRTDWEEPQSSPHGIRDCATDGTTDAWYCRAASVGRRKQARVFRDYWSRRTSSSPGWRGGTRGSRTRWYRQYTWRSDCDCCPVQLVSEIHPRVVHVVW
jgi:hypothetical protein